MPEDNNGDNAGDDNAPELVLDEVLTVEPGDLSDDQRTFLTEHADDLSDEDLKAYEIVRKPDIPDPTKEEDGGGEKDDKGGKGKEGDDIDPDDEKMVSRIIENKYGKRLDAVEGAVGGSSKVHEIDSFIRESPEYAPYREAMLNFINTNPARYNQLSASELAGVVARKDLQKIGARKERETQRKVKETKNPGGAPRKSTRKGGRDWDKMSTDEYYKQRAEALGQGR